MRIIAGKCRGIKLKCPLGKNVRPTKDRIKESLFDMIQFEIENAKILDLFSGSGALGLEALSRGADSVIFVDSSGTSVSCIKENIKNTRLTGAEILEITAEKAVSILKGSEFDIIFMDPPYLKGLIIPVLEKIYENNLLKEDGMIVVEHDANDILDNQLYGFVCVKEKKYGRTLLTYYKLAGV